jgi:hypothetical protein
MRSVVTDVAHEDVAHQVVSHGTIIVTRPECGPAPQLSSRTCRSGPVRHPARRAVVGVTDPPGPVGPRRDPMRESEQVDGIARV